MYQRPQKPDVFELMMFARTRVFVRIDDQQYRVVAASSRNICILTFCKDEPEVQRIEYIDATAQALGLFDGAAWNLPALVTWLDNLEGE